MLEVVKGCWRLRAGSGEGMVLAVLARKQPTSSLNITIQRRSSSSAQPAGGGLWRSWLSALDFDLPHGWHRATTSDGSAYFYHETTGESTWQRPEPLPPGWRLAKDKASGTCAAC